MSLTTDPESPCLGVMRADGQQMCYLVLSEEERAKGFVRPVRRSYKHTGRSVCGMIEPTDKLGGLLRVCTEPVGHDGDHWNKFPELVQPDAARATHQHSIGGCGTVTTMGQAIAETYARDPKFYCGTFCCACGSHFPVNEFEWTDDGTLVGS